jgi:hypothetical protein
MLYNFMFNFEISVPQLNLSVDLQSFSFILLYPLKPIDIGCCGLCFLREVGPNETRLHFNQSPLTIEPRDIAWSSFINLLIHSIEVIKMFFIDACCSSLAVVQSIYLCVLVLMDFRCCHRKQCTLYCKTCIASSKPCTLWWLEWVKTVDLWPTRSGFDFLSEGTIYLRSHYTVHLGPERCRLPWRVQDF